MKKLNKKYVLILSASFLLLGFIGLGLAATEPNLEMADKFAILASSTITNTGLSVVNGDIGTSPGTAITNFPPGTLTGVKHVGDAVALQAQSGLTAAYNNAAGQPCDHNLTGQDLGGMTLTPGVYCFNTSAQLTGILTLNAQGNPDANFIFQIGSTLTTASGSSVIFTNSTQSCRVYWQVGSSATLGTTTAFKGNILALASITLDTDATIEGKLLASTGAVTLDNNTIFRTTCGSALSSWREGTINVVNIVINDNGGSKNIANFPLFVNGNLVVSGVTNSYKAPADAYAVTETADSHYVKTFSGDCDSNGQLTLSPGENKVCIITNNDIGGSTSVLLAPSISDIVNTTVVTLPIVSPLIHVTKIPSTLVLVAGGGLVTYVEKISNPGLVALSNIHLTDDKCSPVRYISGDINNDSKLDTTEEWTYTCEAKLIKTTTNTAIASGEANNLIARDTAVATVVVAIPSLPKAGAVTNYWIIFTGGVIVTLGLILLVISKIKNRV